MSLVPITFKSLEDDTWYVTHINDGTNRQLYIRPQDGIDSHGYRTVETWPIDRDLNDIQPGVPLRTSRVDDRAHIKFFRTEPPFAAFDNASAELARLVTRDDPSFAAFDAASAELARLVTRA